MVVTLLRLMLDGDSSQTCIVVFCRHYSSTSLQLTITFNIHLLTSHNSLPEGATMEQLLDVLGETRLKKMARKNRRSRNQKIREGKVVLNELGEWVERD